MAMEFPELVISPEWSKGGERRVRKPYVKRVPEGSRRRNRIIYALADEKARLIYEAEKTISPEWAWNYKPKKTD